MIEAAGLAFPRAPLDAALARLAAGSVFDALVVASPEAGKFRLSVLGASLDLETALPLEVGERVRLAVKSTDPLTLELRPGVAAKADAEAGARGLAPDLEAAVRAFACGDAGREEAARFLASRGLGLDPSAARGLAALASHPSAAATAQAAPEGARGIADQILATLRSPGAPLRAAAQVAIEGALQRLAGSPEFAALLQAAGESPESAARAAAPLRALPGMREALGLLDTGRVLSDAARALQVLNGDAASRGEGVAYFALGWTRDGRPEGGFGRVEWRPGGEADPAGPARVVVTLELTRLGLLQIVLALAAGAAAVTVAASPASRRLLERDRRGLLEALVRLGLRPELRFSDGPIEPILPRSRGGLDVRA